MRTLEELRARMRELLDQRGALLDQQGAILTRAQTGGDNGAARSLTTEERTQHDGLGTQIDGLDTQIGELEPEITRREQQEAATQRANDLRQRFGGGTERQHDDGRVTGEERTYTRRKDSRGEASFFRDSFLATQRGDLSAMQRLQRHSTEMEREGEISERAIGTGSVGGLLVPQYLTDLAAPILRAGRPTANAIQGQQLPAQGMSLIIPRMTTGAAVAPQATENTVVQNTDEVWSNLTVPVVTIAGQQDLSRQLIERGAPGTDEIVYRDLAAAYHAELDRQVLNGTGTGNTMLGIFQTAGRNMATAYGATITAALFNSKVAGQIAAIAGAGAQVQPNLIVMNPRRWGWLTSLADSTGRPLVVPGVAGPMNILALNDLAGGYSADGDADSTTTIATVGSIQGLPLITDANVPTTVGTNNEDLVGVFDRRQALLWEDGDGQPQQLRFEQTLGNQLTVKLVIYGYAAFTAGRYPAAFGQTGGVDSTAGQGQVAPSF